MLNVQFNHTYKQKLQSIHHTVDIQYTSDRCTWTQAWVTKMEVGQYFHSGLDKWDQKAGFLYNWD